MAADQKTSSRIAALVALIAGIVYVSYRFTRDYWTGRLEPFEEEEKKKKKNGDKKKDENGGGDGQSREKPGTRLDLSQSWEKVERPSEEGGFEMVGSMQDDSVIVLKQELTSGSSGLADTPTDPGQQHTLDYGSVQHTEHHVTQSCSKSVDDDEPAPREARHRPAHWTGQNLLGPESLGIGGTSDHHVSLPVDSHPVTSGQHVSGDPHHVASAGHHIPVDSHGFISTGHHISTDSHGVTSAGHHIPIDSHGLISTGHHISTDSHGVTSAGHHIPVDSHGLISTGHHISTDSHGVTSAGHHIPVDSHGLISTGHHISTDSHGVTSAGHHIPVDSHGLISTGHHVSTDSHGVTSAGHHIPVDSHGLISTGHHVSTDSHGVTSAGHHIPIDSNGMMSPGHHALVNSHGMIPSGHHIPVAPTNHISSEFLAGGDGHHVPVTGHSALYDNHHMPQTSAHVPSSEHHTFPLNSHTGSGDHTTILSHGALDGHHSDVTGHHGLAFGTINQGYTDGHHGVPDQHGISSHGISLEDIGLTADSHGISEVLAHENGVGNVGHHGVEPHHGEISLVGSSNEFLGTTSLSNNGYSLTPEQLGLSGSGIVDSDTSLAFDTTMTPSRNGHFLETSQIIPVDVLGLDSEAQDGNVSSTSTVEQQPITEVDLKKPKSAVSGSSSSVNASKPVTKKQLTAALDSLPSDTGKPKDLKAIVQELNSDPTNSNHTEKESSLISAIKHQNPSKTSFKDLLDGGRSEVQADAGSVSQDDIVDLLEAVDRNALLRKHADTLLCLLSVDDEEQLGKTLVTVCKLAAFTKNQDILREAGIINRLSVLLRQRIGDVRLPDRQDTVRHVSNCINNLAGNEENQKVMQDCIMALIDITNNLDTYNESVQISALQALTNISNLDVHHSRLTRIIRKLYALVDNGSEPVRLQALKVLANLSANQESVLHLLAAGSPKCSIELLDLDTPSELMLRWVTVLANVIETVKSRGITLESLPTYDRAPSPETLYQIIYGHSQAHELRNLLVTLSINVSDATIRQLVNKILSNWSLSAKHSDV